MMKVGGLMRLKTILLILLTTVAFLLAGNNKQPAPQPPESESSGFGIQWGVSAGAAVLNGEVYNQLGIRPVITIGKLGIALDLSLYLDAQGNIREENWDDASDILSKFYYVRWGQQGDPFHVKVGNIDHFRLGYGLLMNRYSNAIDYPGTIRTGMVLGLQGETVGVDVLANNFSESFDGGGVYAGRVSFKLIGDLEVGISAVADVNQYKGLEDSDDDGIPDFVDDFPNDKKRSVDTDGDGIADDEDPDIDGDGYTDNSQDPTIVNNDPDGAVRKPNPFNINKAKNSSQIAFAADVGYPIIKQKYLQLITYAQFAQFGNGGGWGATAPGVRAKFAFIDAFAEYRIFDKKFIPEYFNTTYERERAVARGDSIFTKSNQLDAITEKLQGYVVGADFNIGDFLVFGAEYQDMRKSALELKTLRANLDLNATVIPQINTAGAYFYQNNTSLKKIFDKTEGTIMGYKIGWDIGGGATLLFDFRQTYLDKNNDGKIHGSSEVINSTLIQTVFSF